MATRAGTARKPRPHNSELQPIEWAAIEPHWKAGVRSIGSLAAEFNVAKSAIHRHFTSRGIPRDLSAKIRTQAQAKLDRVNANVAERAVIESTATLIAGIQLAHRRDIAKARAMASKLFAELDWWLDVPELAIKVEMLLNDPDEPTLDRVRELVTFAAGFSQRSKSLRELSETMRVLVGMEREAFGLDTADGARAGKPVVIIRDYTGRNDPVEPLRTAAEQAEDIESRDIERPENHDQKKGDFKSPFPRPMVSIEVQP